MTKKNTKTEEIDGPGKCFGGNIYSLNFPIDLRMRVLVSYGGSIVLHLWGLHKIVVVLGVKMYYLLDVYTYSNIPLLNTWIILNDLLFYRHLNIPLYSKHELSSMTLSSCASYDYTMPISGSVISLNIQCLAWQYFLHFIELDTICIIHSTCCPSQWVDEILSSWGVLIWGCGFH